MSMSDPVVGLQPKVPKDFQIFINLIEFCRSVRNSSMCCCYDVTLLGMLALFVWMLAIYYTYVYIYCCNLQYLSLVHVNMAVLYLPCCLKTGLTV